MVQKQMKKRDNMRTKVQSCQLDVLIEIVNICNSHNITYFITGGTLRGAYICKGFLPNDSDIDIGMPRKDYEKFIAVCADDLPNEYLIQNYHTEMNFGFLYSKIRIKDTEYIDEKEQNVNICKGIFIDIYPFDVMPKHRLQQLKQQFCHKLYKGLLLTHCGYKTKYDGTIIEYIFKFASRYIQPKRLYKIAEKNLMNYNNTNGIYYYAFEGGHGYKERITRKNIHFLVKMNFEGYKFNAPKEHISLLKRIYGENEYDLITHKDDHNIIKTDCGKYRYKNLEDNI